MNGDVISREPLGNGAGLITMEVNVVGGCRLIEWTSDSVRLLLTNYDGAAGVISESEFFLSSVFALSDVVVPGFWPVVSDESGFR